MAKTTKTYAEALQEIENLKRDAEKLKAKEIADVIARMKEAIRVYGISASDLGFTGRSAAPAKSAEKGKSRKAAKGKSAPTVKYRDDAGNTWVGRGPRPHWLRDALASGKELQDFAV